MHTVRIELLQQMPIFGAIRDDALEYLLEPAPSVVLKAGTFFFREGDPSNAMYVIEAGRVAILKRWNGEDLLLRHMEAGDCFGEMALMDFFPRSAAAQVTEDCTAIELEPGHLMRLYERDLEQFALIQMNISREMSRRLRATDELLFRARMGEPTSGPSPVFRTT